MQTVIMLNTTTTNKFGIEIETVGLSLHALVAAIHPVVGGTLDSRTASVTMADGRVWRAVPDGSLSGNRNGEIVSPILSYVDLEMLQNVVRAVRKAGAQVDSSCGIHVHVDGSRFDARGLLNLVNLVHKNERLIERALGVAAHRLSRYTQPLGADFIARLDGRRPRSLTDLQDAWYGRAHAAPHRYDMTRYHGLNLNSMFYRGTVEFRYFNGTLHAGEIKSYVQLCLAMVARAQGARATSRSRRQVETQNEKWAFRVFMKTMGMIGPEFETARLHLTKHLTGNGSNPSRSAARAVTPTTPTES